MGAELPCTLRVGRTVARGKALLETDELLFRGDDLRVKIPLKSIRALEAKDGTLVVRHGDAKEARLELGAHAAKWKEKIEKPKSRVDKLGVRPEQRVAIVGVEDASLEREVRERGAKLVDVARAKGDVDVVFVALCTLDDLKKLATLRRVLARDGSMWTIRAKGKGAPVSEAAAMAAGKAAGLVDVKVARFSETHTAEKWVIPLAKR